MSTFTVFTIALKKKKNVKALQYVVEINKERVENKVSILLIWICLKSIVFNFEHFCTFLHWTLPSLIIKKIFNILDPLSCGIIKCKVNSVDEGCEMPGVAGASGTVLAVVIKSLIGDNLL